MLKIPVEMPQSCSKCPCYDCEYDTCNLTERRFRTIVDGLALKTRAQDCPLIDNNCASWEKADDDNDGTLRCSKCRAVLERSMYDWHNFYYCYHCGAQMSNPYHSILRKVLPEREVSAPVSGGASNAVEGASSLVDRISADIEYAAQHGIELPGEAYLLEAINNAITNTLQQKGKGKDGKK